jgi:hypothetical protein
MTVNNLKKHSLISSIVLAIIQCKYMKDNESIKSNLDFNTIL